MRPWLLRPAWVGIDSIRVLSGVSVVISSKPEMDMKRRPGLVGLNFLTGIGVCLHAPKEAFDLLAFAQSHDGFLPVGGVADGSDAAEVAALLATHVHGVDALDLDALRLVLLFQCVLDLGLARGGD